MSVQEEPKAIRVKDRARSPKVHIVAALLSDQTTSSQGRDIYEEAAAEVMGRSDTAVRAVLYF